MTKDEALRLALEALEDLGNHDRICPQWPTYAEPENYPKCNCGYDQAITAIKAALETKDEPVAWMYPDDLKRFETSEAYAEAYSIEMVSPTQGETVPLYTTPPQRKPLTDEEIFEALSGIDCTRFTLIARAIEAAHGIKE